MVKLNCRKCRKCNRKGKPSVSKHSLYCDKQRKVTVRAKESLYTKLKRIKYLLRKNRIKENKKIGKVKENE